MDLTTKQVKNTPNPNGIGGFKEHPENRNNGGRYQRSDSFTYWFNYFKGISVKDFNDWEYNNPESERSVVSDLAYMRMKRARGNLRDFQDIANRSEGSPTRMREDDLREPEKLELIISDYRSDKTDEDDLSTSYTTDKVVR